MIIEGRTIAPLQLVHGDRRSLVVRPGEAVALDLRELGAVGEVEIVANLRLIATLELAQTPTFTLDPRTLRSLGERVSIVIFLRRPALAHARSTLEAPPSLACAWLDVRVASRFRYALVTMIAATALGASALPESAATPVVKLGDAWSDAKHTRRGLGSNGVSPNVVLTATSAEEFELISRNVVAVPVRATHRRAALEQAREFSLRWEVERGTSSVLVPWAFMPTGERFWWSAAGDAQLVIAQDELVLHALAPGWARAGERLDDRPPPLGPVPMRSLSVSDWSGHPSLQIASYTRLMRVFDDEQLARTPRRDTTVGFTRCPDDPRLGNLVTLASRIWNVPASRGLSIVADESTRPTVGSWSPSERDDAHVWAVICHSVRPSSEDANYAYAWPALDEDTDRVRPIAVLVGAIGEEDRPAVRATLVPRRRRGRFDGFVLRFDDAAAARGRGRIAYQR